ncbi:MAG: hypothetical protein ACOX6I_10555 [Syntrophomonadaceae bacterium]|jgi:hypothetical protein
MQQEDRGFGAKCINRNADYADFSLDLRGLFPFCYYFVFWPVIMVIND